MVKEGRVLNDETLDLLGRQALSMSRREPTLLAPSDMMDGKGRGHSKNS